MHIMSQSEQTIDLTLNAKFIIEFIFSPPSPPKKEDFLKSLVLLCCWPCSCNWTCWGGHSSSTSGWGRLYSMQSSMICRNQDLLDSLSFNSTLLACLWIMLPCNLVTIPNRLRCLMCKRVFPGKEPPRNATTHGGVPSWSLISFWPATK